MKAGFLEAYKSQLVAIMERMLDSRSRPDGCCGYKLTMRKENHKRNEAYEGAEQEVVITQDEFTQRMTVEEYLNLFVEMLHEVEEINQEIHSTLQKLWPSKEEFKVGPKWFKNRSEEGQSWLTHLGDISGIVDRLDTEHVLERLLSVMREEKPAKYFSYSQEFRLNEEKEQISYVYPVRVEKIPAYDTGRANAFLRRLWDLELTDRRQRDMIWEAKAEHECRFPITGEIYRGIKRTEELQNEMEQ